MLRRLVLQGREFTTAGVGEDDVQAATARTYRLGERVEIRLLGDITADPGRVVSDGCDGVIDGLLGAAGEEHVRAFGGHPLRGRKTDAGGATSDECGLAVEQAHDELHLHQETDLVSASRLP